MCCGTSCDGWSRCSDGFTVRALIDGDKAQGLQVLLCHVDGFKYEYKVILMLLLLLLLLLLTLSWRAGGLSRFSAV